MHADGGAMAASDEGIDGKAFQKRYLEHLSEGDVDGMVAGRFAPDARIHTFGYRAGGSVPVAGFLRSYLERFEKFDERTVSFFASGRDYVWQELALRDSRHELEPVDVYEFKFLRGGKAYLQLVGEKGETGWLARTFAAAGAAPVEQGVAAKSDATATEATASDAVARAIHSRYIDYQARGDADGMADNFFTEDVRLATATIEMEGRETLREFFRQKFAGDREFRLVSIRNIAGDDDYVWFEATAASSLGVRTVYDVMLLHEGGVHLQLVGTLEGALPVNER